MSSEHTWTILTIAISIGACLGAVITATVMTALHRRAIRRAEDASWRAASTYHSHIASGRYASSGHPSTHR